MKYLLLLPVFLAGCAAVPGAECVVVKTAALTVVDAAGNVKFKQSPDTVTYCGPSVTAASK